MIKAVWKIIFGAIGLVFLWAIFGLPLDLGMYISGLLPLSEFGVVLPTYLTGGYTYLYNLYDYLPTIILGGIALFAIAYSLYRSYT